MDKRLDIFSDILSRMGRDADSQLYFVEIETDHGDYIIRDFKLTKPEVISLLSDYWVAFQELEDMYLMSDKDNTVKIELRVVL